MSRFIRRLGCSASASRLDLWQFNPLWKTNQKQLLETLVEKKFEVIISGVFAYPLDGKWLGKWINSEIIAKLVRLQGEYGISPSGEGGEIETTVLDAPMFRQKLESQNPKPNGAAVQAYTKSSRRG